MSMEYIFDGRYRFSLSPVSLGNYSVVITLGSAQLPEAVILHVVCPPDTLPVTGGDCGCRPGATRKVDRSCAPCDLGFYKDEEKKLAFEASLMILFEYKFKATELELDGCRHFIFLHILACNELSAHLYVFA